MTTQEMKEKLAIVFPEASKIKVRQYPMSYKGSMRGYTTVTVKDVNDDYFTFKDKCEAALGTLNKTFVDKW